MITTLTFAVIGIILILSNVGSYNTGYKEGYSKALENVERDFKEEMEKRKADEN